MPRSGMIALLLTATAACATANVSSVRRAGSEGLTFDRVMVWVLIEDLGLRREFEERVIAAQPESFIAGTSVLFPGQGYTAEQVEVELERAAVDAVLTIYVADVGSQTGYLPGTVTNFNGTIVNSPPRPLTSNSAQFQGVLQTVSDGQAVWMSSTDTKGAYGSSAASQLVRVAAAELAEALLAEGLIKD